MIHLVKLLPHCSHDVRILRDSVICASSNAHHRITEMDVKKYANANTDCVIMLLVRYDHVMYFPFHSRNAH